jgi:hypothetical protein
MDDIRIVLGSLRYKTSTDTDLSIPTPLVQNSKNIQEFDRSIDVNLTQVFDDERQKSTTFRPTCKFQLLYNNSYTGNTNYVPLENNLYYINETQSLLDQCNSSPGDVKWQGFLQYHEFDFIRSDYNVSGYTQPPNNHINFVSRSASTYNWNFFMSYPYKNIDKSLSYYDPTQNLDVNWNAIDGIPFRVNSDNVTMNGNGMIQFICPVKHGLSVGEFVNIKIPSNNLNQTYQVFGLGSGMTGTEEYIFNIFNIGYPTTTFPNKNSGTFKRVINNENPNDTTSKYYIIQHKIITDVNDAVLVNAGFEKNIFGIKKKFESPVYTPNNIKRVSIKENSQSYTLSFNKDIDVSSLRDNQKRPISDLFVTTIWKGYFGLTFGLQSPGIGYVGLKEGYDFNLSLTNFGKPIDWWKASNSNSTFVGDNNQPYPLGAYQTLPSSGLGPNNGQITFTYMESLKDGDVLDGGFYEWNDYEQKERLISDINHKFTFNPFVFNISDTDDNANQMGYYYKPHSKMKIRSFSDYIETGSINNMVGVPDYSYFSTTYNSFIWRDLYTYGFKDNSGNGVDYPFLNGKHYPYENFIFRIIPEGTNYIESSLNNYATLYGAAQPIKDDCE